MIPSLFVVDRSARGRLRLTGRDRQSFLQGMVTNDVARLEPGEGCYAFQLDTTAHILADMRVLCADGYLLLDVEPGQAAPVASRLEEYLIMERCRIADVSAEVDQILVGGTNAAEALARLGVQGAETWDEGQNAAVSLGGVPCLVARTALLSAQTFDLYFPTEGGTALKRLLPFPTLAEADLEPWRVAAGIPRFGVDLDARVLAPETGQSDRALHYRKGCYIGQEVVARIDARGHTNRGWAGFVLETSVGRETTVTTVDGKVVGRVTSCALVDGRALAVGFLRHDASAPGTPVQVGDVAGVVAALPFAETTP